MRSVASLRRRLLAGVIDGVMLLVATFGAGGLTVWRRRNDDELGVSMRRLAERLANPRVARTLRTGQLAVALATRNARSPGSWIVGVRRVDARTGGPVSIRSALIRQLLQFAVERALRRVDEPRRRRMEERQQELDERVQALRDQFADDATAREQAIGQVQRDNGVNCLAAMVRPLALTLAQPLTALASPRRQNLIERLAGVAVVRDRRV